MHKNVHWLCWKIISYIILLQSRCLERWHDHGDIVREERLNLFFLTTFPCRYWLLAIPWQFAMDEASSSVLGKVPLEVAHALLSEPQTKSTGVTPWLWLLQTRIGNASFCPENVCFCSGWEISPLLPSLGKGLHFYLCYFSTFLLLRASEKALGRREEARWELKYISQGQGIGQTTEFLVTSVVNTSVPEIVTQGFCQAEGGWTVTSGQPFALILSANKCKNLNFKMWWC